MAKLGFTFYPKDWWTSKAFFKLNPQERYIYLECLFLMYDNEGYLADDVGLLSARLQTQIEPKTWEKITDLFRLCELGYWSENVKRRKTKADASRENGKLGGRPRKETITQKPNIKPKNNLPSKEKENIKRIENKEGTLAMRPGCFELFWKTYDHSKNKAKCKIKFLKLKDADVRAIFDTLEAYVNSTYKDGKQFPSRRHPLTYLNQEGWNDEIAKKPGQTSPNFR